MQRFRGGIVFKAHRLLCHSTLGLREMKKKDRVTRWVAAACRWRGNRVTPVPLFLMSEVPLFFMSEVPLFLMSEVPL